MLGYYILFTGVILSLVVGMLVFTRDIRSKNNQIYATLTLTFVALSLANFLSIEESSQQAFLVRTVMFTAALGVYLLYRLVVSFKGTSSVESKYGKIFALSTVVAAGISYTPVLFSEVIAGSPPQPVHEWGIVVYWLHFLLVCGAAAKELYGGINRSALRQRQQLKVILLGLVPVLVLAPVTSFLLPLLGYDQLVALTPLYVLYFVCCVGYAIVRHGLFDIKFAAVRTTAYVFSLCTLSAAYYVVAYMISVTLFKGEVSSSVSISPINILLALLLAFIFQPIRRFFDRITNSIFYRDQYSAEDFYASFSSALASTTDLRVLLERSSHEVEKALKAEQVFFHVYRQNRRHISAGTKGHSKLPLKDTDFLDEYVDSNGLKIVITGLLDDNSKIRRLLHSHRIEILLPLASEGIIVGYLALGEHRGRGYTSRDVRTISTISDEMVIAIQNSLSIQAVKELNATLQHRIDTATKELRKINARLRQLDETKDEFISMASHQLRTPLTSVKGYISMLLEGDAGKLSGAQRKFLEEAFSSSERMVHLVGDFLNVSRLQTGKFMIDKKDTSLDALVNQEVDNLRRTAESHEVKLKYSKPKDFPSAVLDEGKIRQVIMNFLDNAIYYSPAGSVAEAILKLEDGNIVFKVIDSGIGVPESEQSGLFGKFYRASNARRQRPDGTGVGLFLAKKVVNAHGGEIIFESKEGKGSTFGFKIPLVTSGED